jgi:GDPmannose 4,6-dehydratase
VREFVDLAFRHVDLNWQDYVRSDSQFSRPAEVDHLTADATKARQKLGWRPTISLEELVQMMVDADLKAESGER